MTEPDAEVGIHVVACPSGWCAKVIEGTTGAYRTDGECCCLLILYQHSSHDNARQARREVKKEAIGYHNSIIGYLANNMWFYVTSCQKGKNCLNFFYFI